MTVTEFFVCTSNPGKLREFKDALGDNGTVKGLGDFGFGQSNQDGQPVYAEPVEDENFFLGNALKKFKAAQDFLVQVLKFRGSLDSTRIIVDDSGLCVPLLGGLPGVHSATYSGMPRDDGRNRNKLAQAVASHPGAAVFVHPLGKKEKRLEAYFVSVVLCSIAQEKPFESPQEPTEEWEKTLLQTAFANSQGSSPIGSLVQNIATEQGCLLACYGFSFGFVSSEEQCHLHDEGHGYDAIFYPRAHPELSFASIALKEKNKLSHRGLAALELRNAIERSG